MKIMRLSDVYIRVDIKERWPARGDADKHKKKLSDAGGIVESIRRHVDDIDGVSIVEEFDGVCGFCDSRWTEKSETYNGGCCEDDEANNPNPEE